MTTIGSLNEKPLHAALKEWYFEEGDRVECPIDEFVVDLVRGDLLIEIQTGGFSALRRKLDRLLDGYAMRLVHPIPARKWIVNLDADGRPKSRRRSPRAGVPADVFAELVSFPSLLTHPNFSIELALVEEEEVRRPDAGRRRRYAIEERRLLTVTDTVELSAPEDLVALLPGDLPERFTTADLAMALNRPRRFAQQVAYCLRVSGAAQPIDKVEGAVVYLLVPLRRPGGGARRL